MGMKAIEAKRAELEKREDAMKVFVAAAGKLQEALSKVQKLGEDAHDAYVAMYDKKRDLLPAMTKLDTLGIKEFEQYKEHMVSICKNEAFKDRLFPFAPIQKVVTDARKETDKLMNDWLEKQAAAMPKVFKKGMTFRDYTQNRVFELTSDEEKAENDRLRGDDAIFVKTIVEYLATGKKSPLTISKGDLLKSKLKFLKV
jgi:hypothetical protein